MLSLDIQLLTVLVSTVIPIVVGLVTKLNAKPTVKTVVNLALSALTGGLILAIEADGTVETKAWVLQIVLAFGASLAAHYNLWKPLGITARVNDLAPNLGIGTAQDPLDLLLTSLSQRPGVTAIHLPGPASPADAYQPPSPYTQLTLDDVDAAGS